ncbi:hypothetical protein BGZ61DRAFT_341030 [Ilyonectria robusta]|uniref:uncharacterized protein n=1 Tax=Ilyonectria robusta TaxID=1079257 RepID=UPI001E8E6565|nr:uncharacterized protein BGZ61DRAFT_341030 [Ilyonectria robusta]KAH8736528.1 hypothetical protein BGZ61DRAFT_341030 [Ilyonectria robusta]
MKDSDASPSSPADAALALQGSGSIASTSSSVWNTKNLGFRLGVDAVSAACAASMVAPLIAMIDRSVMENASGRSSLASSIASSIRTLLRRPHTFLFSKPTALIFLVYGSTYLTANTVDTSFSTLHNRPASSVTAGATKFAASSAANIGIGIYKDQVFVRLFGPPGVVPRAVPLPAYTLFAARDCLTIFASFNVPPILGPYLDSRFSDQVKARMSGLSTAQFLAPAAVQFISTPMHLLGLDLYNSPSTTAAAVSMRDRWDAVRRNWTISSFARIGRIVPAFGIGGVVNTKVRRSLMQKLE